MRESKVDRQLISVDGEKETKKKGGRYGKTRKRTLFWAGAIVHELSETQPLMRHERKNMSEMANGKKREERGNQRQN